MKTEKNILIAFILNLLFSGFEFIGGVFTGSIAIISDAIHDLGDAFSIGISYFLEKKSKQKPDDNYTYGYTRYSIIGALITITILLVGSILIFINALKRIKNPVAINYEGMIMFAIIGFIVNLISVYFTKDSESLNEKAVNLHMLEDVLGWLVVLIGAFVMKFTNLSIIDPLMSILVAIFIFISSLKNLKEIMDLFLEKTPKGISINKIRECILEIEGVINVHHIHVWSMDGINNYATMHVVVNKKNSDIKLKIRQKLKKYKINHVTIEIEEESEVCSDSICHIVSNKHHHYHH